MVGSRPLTADETNKPKSNDFQKSYFFAPTYIGQGVTICRDGPHTLLILIIISIATTGESWKQCKCTQMRMSWD
jgi:hypothetical protein